MTYADAHAMHTDGYVRPCRKSVEGTSHAAHNYKAYVNNVAGHGSYTHSCTGVDSVVESGSVQVVSKTTTQGDVMTSYAEYLNSLTVKTLNSIAKDMGLKGYSKLRKAALVMIIDDAIAALDIRWESEETIRGWHIIALDMNNAKPVEVTFSSAPAKAPQSTPKATEAAEVEQTTAEDLKYAYQAMRATLHKARGITHAKIAARMRKISIELRAMGINMRTV